MIRWVGRSTAICAVSAVLLGIAPAAAFQSAAGRGRSGEDPAQRTALGAATRDLCGRDVVLLGENDYHGDGSAIGFKVKLIRRLVGRCHFNAIFFEASHYDFLALSEKLRTGQPVSANMVSSAIGWIWNHDLAVARFIPFLFSGARSGRVVLGGLDDQLGGLGEFYSIEEMPRELTSYLSPTRAVECRERLRQKIWGDYPATSPHDENSRDRLQQCLLDIRSALTAEKDVRKREFLLQLVANAQRHVEREFEKPDRYVAGRDRSMYLNLRWLAARLPPHSKIIIWAENFHVAKDAAIDPSFAGVVNFGSYVHRFYGERAFMLGFSSAAGSFRYSAHQNRILPAAPSNSVEADALARGNREIVYLGRARLAGLGKVPGGIFDHQYVSAYWPGIVDGLVVFRTERPVKRIDE